MFTEPIIVLSSREAHELTQTLEYAEKAFGEETFQFIMNICKVLLHFAWDMCYKTFVILMS